MRCTEKGDPGMTFYALNLFDLAENDSYLRYSRRSPGAVAKHDGRVVALGMLDRAMEEEPEVEPRTAMILVERASRESPRTALSLINSIAREGKADSSVPIIADKALIYNVVSPPTMLPTRPLFSVFEGNARG